MASQVPPKKNTAYTFYTSLVSRGSRPQFQANPTLAAGDVKIAIDDGAPANLATLPVVDADFTRRVKVALSASEMNGDVISIIFADQAGDEWDDQAWLFMTAAQTLDEVDVNVDAILADTGTDGVVLNSTGLATSAAQEIADVIIRRTMANAEASSHGDTLDLSSLYGLIQMAQEASISGTTMTVKKTDGSTTLGTKSVTVNASANPITGVS